MRKLSVITIARETTERKKFNILVLIAGEISGICFGFWHVLEDFFIIYFLLHFADNFYILLIW